jgi:hypothetical protein
MRIEQEIGGRALWRSPILLINHPIEEERAPPTQGSAQDLFEDILQKYSLGVNEKDKGKDEGKKIGEARLFIGVSGFPPYILKVLHSIMISPLEYSDQLFLKISPH